MWAEQIAICTNIKSIPKLWFNQSIKIECRDLECITLFFRLSLSFSNIASHCIAHWHRFDGFDHHHHHPSIVGRPFAWWIYLQLSFINLISCINVSWASLNHSLIASIFILLFAFWLQINFVAGQWSIQRHIIIKRMRTKSLQKKERKRKRKKWHAHHEINLVFSCTWLCNGIPIGQWSESPARKIVKNVHSEKKAHSRASHRHKINSGFH